MKGYWNREDATKEAIDADGWFHTGDIGVVDADGFIRITDRKKDIIVTAGGKNVAPQNLENLLKNRSSLVSQVVVHGDKRKFLSAVVTLDEENLKKWAATHGLSGEHATLSQQPAVQAAIAQVFHDVNATLASYEMVKRFKVLDHDFTVGDKPDEQGRAGADLLTPSLKVKRKAVNERYKDVFDAFYAGDATARRAGVASAAAQNDDEGARTPPHARPVCLRVAAALVDGVVGRQCLRSADAPAEGEAEGAPR